tara:strand:+ start:59 stop:508 length:450 start_codon:yes stop_codon:yes gene_type:complete
METLAPSILEIRDSFLEKFKNEKLVIISKKLTELFDVEEDPVKKIVLLASRVETIRKRIDQIHQDENKTKIIQENSNETSNETSNEEKEVKAENDTEKNEKSNSEKWIRVIMKESTEVNGVRFPEGIQIDVTEDDSKKLIESGKAAIIA